jgi:hypothetical protein
MTLKTLVYTCDKNLASPIDLGIPLLPLHAVSAKPPRQNITHPIKTGIYVLMIFSGVSVRLRNARARMI